MTTLADVLVYLEVYADDSALITLQEFEIPRIRRQRNPGGVPQCNDTEVAVTAALDSIKS